MQKKGAKISFFLLVLGTQIADLLWGLFTILGFEGGLSGGSVEHNYFDIPWSHSLTMIIVWSVLYGYGTHFYLKTRYPEITNFGQWAGLSVFSHWLLDFPVHNDDMLLFPTDDTKVPTFFLWDYPLVTFLLEMFIVLACWYYYWSRHEESEFKSSKKPFVTLGLLVLLHIIGYFPTFSDSDPVKSDVSSGVAVFIMIPLIAVIMTWLHPLSKK